MPTRKRRNRRKYKGLPQMMVAVSREPEFGNPISLTWAYKFLNRKGVSAPMERVKEEAMRRLRDLRSRERAA